MNDLIKNKRDLIVQLKEYREQQGLSHQKITDLVNARAENLGNDEYVSLSTVKRIFKEGSEEMPNFNYDKILRPIARTLLHIDESDVKSENELSVSVIRYKDSIIEQLEKEITQLHKQFLELQSTYERRVDFLKQQIETWKQEVKSKDDQINMLLEIIRDKH